MSITPENLVSREVHYCVSYLVSTLAAGYGALFDTRGPGAKGVEDLAEQAFDLASPIDDWEEAASEAGWRLVTDADRAETRAAQVSTYRNGDSFHTGGTWADLCQTYDIDPYQREVYEHWIVSDWLADKLIEEGEKVDKDFAGLTVWARTTTGQAIYADHVIEAITAELNAA